MAQDLILHETRTRLRLRAPAPVAADALARSLGRVPGVLSVRANARLGCVVVRHDGDAVTRDAVLRASRSASRRASRGSTDRESGRAPGHARDLGRGPGHGRDARTADARATDTARTTLAWSTAALAASLPVLPRAWQPGAGLGVVAARAATQLGRRAADAPAVLLDSVSLGALAVAGQAPVVSASVLLRLAAEGLASRLVRQADALLRDVLPHAADAYPVLRADEARPTRRPLRQVRPGDRLRLADGDVVPVDGCVTGGSASLHSVRVSGATRSVGPGDHVRAGERLVLGAVEVLAESDAAGSRLERLRAQVAHAIASQDPVGRLAPDLERWVSLPLSGAAVVLGLTGDGARAAAMLQADPTRGLDLALPVAREAAQYVLARHGLLSAGLVSIERLAEARTLLLQDTGVLSVGRWTLAAVRTEPGGEDGAVRQWLARLAGIPEAALEAGGIADPTVREWVRHGALLRLGRHELQLATARRLRGVWDLPMPDGAPAGSPRALRRALAFVADGRVVATVVLECPLRPDVDRRLARLRALGFERIAVFTEDDGVERAPHATGAARPRFEGVESIEDRASAVRDWLDADGAHGAPVVLVHTVLRDLVPPGSLGLAPANADAGAHGVLLGDPLESLETARALARRVRRRLRTQQGLAVGANAALMTVAALRWLPPMATALLHHGFALAVLLDSLRLERMSPPAPRSLDDGGIDAVATGHTENHRP